MKTLYIDQQSARLQRDGAALAIYLEGKRHSSLPIKQLERIVTLGKVELDTALLGALAEAGVELVMLSGRQHKRYAQMSGHAHADAERRLQQYRRYDDPLFRDRLAHGWITAKCQQQIKTLQQMAETRPDLRRPLQQGVSRLEQSLATLTARDPTRPQLLGIEGAAARSYFQAWAEALPPALGFQGRERRPPPDPVNSLLSLGYSMLHSEAVTACRITGLDPALGFYHELSYGRESLAADLIEPLRPRYDRWVWRQLAEQQFRAHHFNRTPQGCFLTAEGRELFFPAFEVWVRPMRRYLRQQGFALIRSLSPTAQGGV